jgi:hypothetical protein
LNLNRTSALLLAATLLAWRGYVSPSACAQQDEANAAATRPQRQHAGGADQPSPGEHGWGARLGRLPGAHLFRPLPEDQGPLRAGEQEELLSFIHQHMPETYESLDQLRQSDPAAFRERLQKAAPPLRRLRRIFERDSELGQSVIRHSENVQRLRRARRAWLASEQDHQARRGIEDLMRRTVAENVAIETAVLDDQVRELDWRREARIAAEFERLTSPDADLAGEPPEVRELVRQLHEAQLKDELEWVEDELWVVCAERMDREVRALQERVERLRANAAEQVDRRMQRLTSRPERGLRDCPGPRRSNQHTGDSQGRGDD